MDNNKIETAKEWLINNQYLVVEKIGVGGLATVYKAWDSMLQKFVAIKKIHEEYCSDAKYVDLFRSEAVNTAKLEQENIVRVVNFIKDSDDHFYIVMDYVKGVDLEYMMGKCRANSIGIPHDIALYIVSEVLKALDYAHTIKDELTEKPLNIVHRDVSPGNVMLYYDGRIKLTDFGIAKARERQIKTGKKEELKGKISYMSPEQAEGENIDTRSDLFSCGAILYEVLTGNKAFYGDNNTDIWQKVRNASVDFKKLKDSEVPDEIQRILKKILQKSPEKRYQSAAEMFIEIKRYLSKKATTEELLQEYKSFIREIMEKEIIALKKEMERDSNLDLDAMRKVIEKLKSKDAHKQGPDEIPHEQTVTKQPEEAESPAEPEPVTPPEAKEMPSEKPPAYPEEIFDREPGREAKPVKRKQGYMDFKIPIATQPSDTQGVFAPLGSPGPEEPKAKYKEDADRTVLDFVLDTAKRYKSIFKSVLISICIGIIGFATLDTFVQFTVVGIKIHNMIWPPALQIDSVPSNAHVELIKDNVNIIEKNGYRSVTPSYIKRIPPGTYTLRIIKEGYGMVVRRVTVFGKQKGKQSIAIAGAMVVKGVYVVPFDIEFEVTSTPSNAALFINGKKIGQTPFKGTLEMGTHNFYLTKSGFETLGKSGVEFGYNPDEIGYTLGICMLDTSKPVDKQSTIDYRFWNLKEVKAMERCKHFVIHGRFWKRFNIKSLPSGARVYIDDSPHSVGITPVNNLVLSVGEHKIEIKKNRYITWKRALKVGAKSSEYIKAALKRTIRIYAYHAGKYSKDIGARVTVSGTKISGKTPLKVTLPYGKYTFKLTKYPAYKPVTITENIGKLEDKWKVKMELYPPHLEVTVKDYATAEIIRYATVWINENYWKRVNKMGIASGYLSKIPGEISITVKADEYEDVKTAAVIKKGHRTKLEVMLGVPKDGQIVIEIPPYVFSDVQIYLDGEYIGENSQIISGVSRSHHDVKFQFSKENKSITKKIKISGPNQVFILKPVRKLDKIYIHEEYPSYIEITIKDYDTGAGIKSAFVLINNVLWGQSDKNGVAGGYIKGDCEELRVEVRAGDYKYVNRLVFIKKKERKKLKVKLGAPMDGTVVLDIPDEFYDVSVYLDGEYMGDNLPLITDVARMSHVVEIKSDAFKERVLKTIDLDKPEQLVILQLAREGKKVYLKESSSKSEKQ